MFRRHGSGRILAAVLTTVLVGPLWPGLSAACSCGHADHAEGHEAGCACPLHARDAAPAPRPSCHAPAVAEAAPRCSVGPAREAGSDS